MLFADAKTVLFGALFGVPAFILLLWGIGFLIKRYKPRR
jgi:hypothetical protein